MDPLTEKLILVLVTAGVSYLINRQNALRSLEKDFAVMKAMLELIREDTKDMKKIKDDFNAYFARERAKEKSNGPTV